MTHPLNGEIERYTDHYFNRSKQVIGKFGDARVTYAIFMRRPVVFAPRLALDWLAETGRERNTKVEVDLRNEELRFLDRASRRELGRLTFPGGGPQGITVTPDGRYLLQSLSKQARVAIIDVGTRAVVGHLAAGETPDGVAYSTRVTAGAR